MVPFYSRDVPMRRALTISMRLLCLALALIFLVFFFKPDLLSFLDPILSIFGSKWFGAFNAVGVRLIYLGIAAWAWFARRKAASPAYRALLLSIVAVAALVLSADLMRWLQPQYGPVLLNPIETALSLLFSALVVLALLLNAFSRRQVTVVR
jgi:hypothetical protein